MNLLLFLESNWHGLLPKEGSTRSLSRPFETFLEGGASGPTATNVRKADSSEVRISDRVRRRGTARPSWKRLLLVLMAALFVLGDGAVILGLTSHLGATPIASGGAPVAAVGHPTRASILLHLERVPGNHFNGIVQSIGKSVGEVRHHLNVLKREQWVREVRQGQRRRYYAVRTTSEARNKVFETLWSDQDNRLRVLHVVLKRGALGPTQVAGEIGISRQLAAYHLMRHAGSGEIHREQGVYYRRGWSSSTSPVMLR